MCWLWTKSLYWDLQCEYRWYSLNVLEIFQGTYFDVGTVTKIKVGHDDTGIGPGWKPQTVGSITYSWTPKLRTIGGLYKQIYVYFLIQSSVWNWELFVRHFWVYFIFNRNFVYRLSVLLVSSRKMADDRYPVYHGPSLHWTSYVCEDYWWFFTWEVSFSVYIQCTYIFRQMVLQYTSY